MFDVYILEEGYIEYIILFMVKVEVCEGIG